MFSRTSGRARPGRFLSSFVAVAAFMAGTLTAAGQTANAQGGPLPVTVSKPLIERIVEWDEYTGRFEASERVEIRARVSGFLDSVHFREGDIVQKGDLLFAIDPRPFVAERSAARAALARAQVRLDLAEKELDRGEQLLTRRTISQEVVDERRAERDAANADVQEARANLRLAELNLEFTQVAAPFTGRVSDYRADVGSLISGGTDQSTLLTTIVSLDPILFTFTASEAEFLKYARLSREGGRDSSRDTENPVFVRLMDETEWTRAGRMSFVDNELSEETGTIRAKAFFENPDLFLTPGIFGRLRLVGSDEYDAMLLPDTAVVSDQSNKIVLVVNAENIVEPRLVVLGPLHEGLRVIRSGITPEDRVVVNGIVRARPGAEVIPQEEQVQLVTSSAAAASN